MPGSLARHLVSQNRLALLFFSFTNIVCQLLELLSVSALLHMKDL